MIPRSLIRTATRTYTSSSAQTSMSANVTVKPPGGGGGKPGPHSLIPVFQDLAGLRRWRRHARRDGRGVGVVPTMGALHEGHAELVRRSLAQNAFTVLTLFVNPTQFAPHEDLASYPRTLPRDLELLRTLLPPSYVGAYEERYRRALGQEPASGGSGGGAMAGLGVSESDPIRWVFAGAGEKGRRRSSASSSASSSSSLSSSSYPAETLESPLVVFAPQRETMYPLSTIPPEAFLDELDADGRTANGDGAAGEAMLQDTARQRGAFVEVKGWGDVLEGESRPQFFRGVATVCTKLFNAVEPDHAYFGQKDIQQALLLKLMLKDLLCNAPSADNLHIVPTSRDPVDSLALSSRNAYLLPEERPYAPTLFRALSLAREYLAADPNATATEALDRARHYIEETAVRAAVEKVEVRLDHVDCFERTTFARVRGPVGSQREVVLVGAMWVGRTRLIDNLLVNWDV
ncbi:hypothetical protein NliqN6_0878 [Naganishia liquefaciens]|uniref:Pantoate--beta-alanine ligase n=1 Tax=Naganishia liquefaciens TaxID=104408 RepID=A0A8H3YE72_9TREE|nr:hypothetical protein NliqN6_0878 [Naganishia liquefaciens]